MRAVHGHFSADVGIAFGAQDFGERAPGAIGRVGQRECFAGGDVAVKVLAGMIAAVVGFKGTIIFDASKPDGAMRKLLDSRRMRKLGWRPRVELKQGIEETYAWYKTNVKRDTGCVKRCS